MINPNLNWKVYGQVNLIFIDVNENTSDKRFRHFLYILINKNLNIFYNTFFETLFCIIC